jgi:hypothetical protein
MQAKKNIGFSIEKHFSRLENFFILKIKLNTKITFFIIPRFVFFLLK